MDIKPENFNMTHQIQIRFNDIDAIGHVNNSVYFSFFDLGKTYYFENIKARHFSWMEGAIVLARSEVDYYSPIYYKESIVVDTKIIQLGNKSGKFLQQIRNVKTGEIKCRCISVFVAYNTDLQTSMPIPAEWKKAIEEFEGVSADIMEVKG